MDHFFDQGGADIVLSIMKCRRLVAHYFKFKH